MLRRRGVSHHDAHEAAQETAARAISTGVGFDGEDDLFRWASVVGWRIAIDQRRRVRRVSGDSVPDRADAVDVASIAEQRIVLDAVRERLTELSTSDREVLLSSFEPVRERTRAESVRLAVARHRARNRLRALLDGLAAPVLGLWARRIRTLLPRAEHLAIASTPAVACLAITVGALTGAGMAPPVATTAQAAPVVASALPSPVLDLAPVAPPAPEQPVATAPRRSDDTPAWVPSTQVVVPHPDGDQTRVGTRNGSGSEPVWCLTPPPAVGLEKTCVDVKPPGS